MIDPGAIGKGYIADKMKEYIVSKGVKSAIINLGGNVLTIGKSTENRPFKIGVRKPFADESDTISVVEAEDESVVSSGSYERYFEITLDNIRAFSGFDSLGHLDYISRYGQQAALKNANNTGESALNYDDYNELIDEILLFLIRHDKALEVNTAPYRHNLPEPNPSRRILQRYHELGGRLITTGADAHTPSDIAIGFDTLKDLLKNAGFSSFFVYKERKPIEYPL